MTARAAVLTAHVVPGDAGPPMTTVEAYRRLYEIAFKEDEIRALLKAAADIEDDDFGTFAAELASSLKVPWGSTFLGSVGLASFMLHRTVAQYTPMLGTHRSIPPPLGGPG